MNANAESFITINGRQLAFTRGETILEVARRHQIFIPTLCHLAGTTPTGACRICVVEVEGARSLMTACTVPAAPKMVVHTQTPKVIESRRLMLSLLLAAGNHNCASRSETPDTWTGLQARTEAYDGSPELCAVYGECKLQALAYRYQVRTGALAGRVPAYPLENASPLILRDFSRCILCGRCVQACNDVQVNLAISNGYRGAKAKIVVMGDDSLDRSDCVFCGECVQACPVGALVDTRSRYHLRPWEATRVQTTCGYCGVGCRIELQIKDGRIARARGLEKAEPNHGRLCVKGRFGFDYLNAAERLTRPLVRKNGKLVESDWDEALDLVVKQIKEIKAHDGPDAVAGIASAGLSSEALYAFQRMVRGAIGTHNLAAPFASMPMTGTFAEMEQAPVLFLIGSDVTEENPVAGTFLKRAARAGRTLIVADGRATRIAGHATFFLQVKEGTEAILIQGLIRLLLESGNRAATMDRDTLAQLHAAVAEYSLERVTGATGVPAAAIQRAAELLGGAEPVMLVYGSRVAAWHPEFVQLQTLLGNLDREHGGVCALGDLANSQGAQLMGIHPALLPGYAPVGDAVARETFAHAWGTSLPEQPGRGLAELLSAAAGKGPRRVRMLLSAGEDLAVVERALPDAPRAVEQVEFLVQFDTLKGETHEHAHVVLPLAAWSEEDGVYISSDRRLGLAPKAVEPPDGVRPAVWVFTEIGRRLGAAWPQIEARQLWESEIAMRVPQLAGATYARIAAEAPQWPVGPDGRGTARLGATAPAFVKPDWVPLNPHHRRLLAHCEGLLDQLASARGAARKAEAPSDPAVIRREMEELLDREGKREKQAKLDEVLARYRPRRGGLIPVLQIFQESLGYLPVVVQNYIALGLGLSAADVYGVVSFYAFFTMTPRGRHTIRVCLGTACYVKEAGKILENIIESLKIKVGETTEDRLFTLTGVRCVGACGLAPVVVVDEDTHGMVDPAKAAALIEAYRSK